jgi:hypothetical protein
MATLWLNGAHRYFSHTNGEAIGVCAITTKQSPPIDNAWPGFGLAVVFAPKYCITCRHTPPVCSSDLITDVFPSDSHYWEWFSL